MEHIIMEQEFWMNIICYFKQEGCLQEESFNRLSEFMMQENFGFLFEGEVPENYDYEACKNKLANDFATLKRQYEERNLSLSRFPEEMLALKAKYAVNEDFYIKQNFAKAEIYVVLYEVFKDKYERLLEHCKQNTCYEKYGKYRNGNCYCVDPIKTLVVGGAGRGTFYKRTPKVFQDSIGKYSYDQTGALLLFEWYPEEHETRYIREFQLRSSHYSYRIVYYEDGRLINIAFQRYQQGRIVEHETVTLSWWKELKHIDIKRGNCIYSDGQLRECLNEEYLSGTGTGGLLQRMKYSFVSDEEGFLKGHRVEELWGDGRRRYLFQGKLCDDSDHFYEFTDKARKDTGKDAWRWRVPNYFIL